MADEKREPPAPSEESAPREAPGIPEPAPPAAAPTPAPLGVGGTRGVGGARDRVVVVGAGIAGLIAAYELSKRGVPVTVLECAPHPGGRARSEVRTIGGRQTIIHHAAQMSSTGYHALVPIIDELGLSPYLIENSRLTSVLFRGELVQIDDRDVYSTKGTLLSNDEWWAYGQQAHLFWNRALRGRSVADPGHWRDLERESAATLVRDLGEGPARLLNGLVHALYFQPPEAVSRALPLSLWTTLIDDEAPVSLRGGFGMLIEALVKKIGDVRCGQEVSRVESMPDGVKLIVNGAVLHASDVVIATTADVARQIHAHPSPAESELLQVGYVPTFNIALDVEMDWFHHRALAGTYGIRVPVDEMKPGDVIASISLESGRLRRRTPGHETLQIMLDADRAPELIGQPAERVCYLVIDEAERKKLLPGIRSASPNYWHVFEIPVALPRIPPGRFDVIRRYEQSISPISRVKLAGDFRGFPRVGSAALSGVAAAAETLNARRARHRPAGPMSYGTPERPGRRPSTAGDELRDAVLGYQAAVGRWGESLMSADLHGATAAWVNGWRSFWNGMNAAARAMGRSGGVL